MTSRSRKVETQLTADEKDLLRGLATAKRELKTFEAQVDKAGLAGKTAATQTQPYNSTLGTMQGQLAGAHSKALMLAGGVGVATAALGAGVGMVMRFASAASDLGESQSKVNTILGSSSIAVHKFANDTAQAMGLSQRAAFEAAGGYANMFNTIGLGQEESAQMSVRLVQLAADMASFNNEDPSEMLGKLRSGLAGQAEPLRTMGVLLSEARVKQEAYATGLAKTGAELTEAQKVQARYQLILKDTTVQHGDFERTIGESLPNSMRQMGAAWDNLQVKIGKGVSGPMKGAVDTGTNLIGVLDQLIDRAGKPIKFTVQMIFDPTQWLTDNVFGQPFGTDPQNPERSLLGRGARALERSLTDDGIRGSQWGVSPNSMTGPSLWADDVFDSGPGKTLPTALDTQRDMDFQKMLDRAVEFGKERERNTDPITGLTILPKLTGSTGGGSSPAARRLFGAGSLDLIGGIMGRLPGSPGGTDVGGYDAAVAQFAQIRAGVTRELATLGLSMADMSARGEEQSDRFKEMEERADALNDALRRVGYEETLRLDSIRDTIAVTREAIEAEQKRADEMKRNANELLAQLWRANPNQSAQAAAAQIGIASAVASGNLDAINVAVARANAAVVNPEVKVTLSSDLQIANEP